MFAIVRGARYLWWTRYSSSSERSLRRVAHLQAAVQQLLSLEAKDEQVEQLTDHVHRVPHLLYQVGFLRDLGCDKRDGLSFARVALYMAFVTSGYVLATR